MSDELWSDNRIAANMEDVGAYLDSYIGEKLWPIVRQMRDEYEAELAQLRAAADPDALMAAYMRGRHDERRQAGTEASEVDTPAQVALTPELEQAPVIDVPAKGGY